MTAPGNYPALQSSGLAVIPIEHQTLLSAGLREVERGQALGGGGPKVYLNWTYWGIVQVTNPVAVTDYQHNLTLTWKPGMNFDFSDIRFAQQDGTICPYWIETYTSKTTATVWIKVPSANQRQILLYYGNPQATSESSITGMAASGFGDEFGGSSLNTTLWTSTTPSTLEVTGGYLHLAHSTTAVKGIYGKTSFGTNYALRARRKKIDDDYPMIGFDQRVPGTGEKRAIHHASRDAPPYVPTWTAETYVSSQSRAYYGTNDTNWHTIDVIRNGSTSLIVKIDGATVGPVTSNVPTIDIAPSIAGQNVGEQYVDWVFIRKYSATEPTLALKQYGPRPEARIIYYPFLPSPSTYLKYTELIELAQTMTGETPIVSLGPIVTFTQTMTGATPITDYYEAAISPTQTQRVKVFAKLYLNLALVRTKKITISKSVQDHLWRADIDLHQYKNLDMAVLRHCTYTTTDHLGSSHTLFTGILPGAHPQLAPADETTRITGYDYGWYLTQRKVPEAYLHNTASTNPATVITGLLGGDDWMTETGIEPYSIQTVSEWGDTLNSKVWDFDRTTSRLQAIQRICDYCRYVFIVKWRDIGGGILNPCAYFCHEDDIDTYLDLPSEVTFTKPDPYVIEPITWEVKGDEKYNRVTVYGRDSTGSSITYTDETADVTNGDEIPVEFVESSGAFTTEAQVQARAEELLTYFSTTQKTYTVTLNLRTDLELLQKVTFSGWTEIPEVSMRIISISYTVDDATATKRVQIQVTSETKLSQIRRMYRGMNPDPLSEADALFDAKAASMPGNDVGTITAISEDGTEATVELEDGRTVTARIV